MCSLWGPRLFRELILLIASFVMLGRARVMLICVFLNVEVRFTKCLYITTTTTRLLVFLSCTYVFVVLVLTASVWVQGTNDEESEPSGVSRLGADTEVQHKNDFATQTNGDLAAQTRMT